MTGMTWRTGLALVLASAWCAQGLAQDAEKAEASANKAEAAAENAAKSAKAAEDAAKSIPTSGNDFTGDRLTLRTNVYGLALQRDGNQKDSVAPAGTRFRVIADAGGDLIVAIESIPCVIKKEDSKSIVANPLLQFGPSAEVDCGKIEINKIVRPGEAYKLSKSVLVEHGYRRSGWVYGALLVPYKYHRHDKSFSSAATIGPYLGYRLDGLGFDSAFIGSIGIASLAVQNNTGGTTNLQGYTMAFGLIASITKNKNPLQFGVLLGRDWAGSNAAVPYQHEGKTWLAVQIGFSFSE